MGLIDGVIKGMFGTAPTPDEQAKSARAADDRRAQRAEESRSRREQAAADMAAYKAEMRKPLKDRNMKIINGSTGDDE